VLLRIQALAGPEQVVSARLLPELEAAPNGKPAADAETAEKADTEAEVASKA
jgi:hypothetical protein